MNYLARSVGLFILNRVDRRRNKPFTSVRRDVRDAILSNIVGGGLASRAEPKILHITQWRVLDPDQGALVYILL